ncbi:MAG: fatty acyl-AMP ligase [Alphaproteobacteria bacterium]|nr:fatty acyl-AMP ligase [Alphaproteobacteria bacterium]MCW5742059.1 fatty acyl-AMP ligase [Alphaproteobacteria bacterium]
MTPTATANTTLPFRRAGFMSVPDMLDYAARGQTGVNFYDPRGRLTAALSWSEVRERAHVFARRLIGAGFARGERLLITADTWPGFMVSFFGAQYAGLLPVPVSLPAGLGGKDAYLDQLKRQLTASGAVAALATDELADYLSAAAEGSAARLAGPMSAFEALPEKPVDLRPWGAGERCYLQFSSGSTRFPLGVDIRQDALMANIAGMTGENGLAVTAQDHVTSWLPLYHDMGLIGFMLGPLSAQRSIDYLSSRDFARRPLQWLSLISQRRTSITYSPSFGYDLTTRRAQTQSLDGIDLSCVRIAGIGGDMIQPSVLSRFAERFGPAGFDERAFTPSYGMAEVCLALSFGHRGDGFRVDEVDRERLSDERIATAVPQSETSRTFVLCGLPLPKHTVEIRGEAGQVLPERRVGRIFAQGPSIMAGYFEAPEASAEALRDGWLDTGDLGYWLDGQLVVTGRAKDLIIVNGRNIWPQDIEWSVEELPQLRRGDVCAFSIDAEDGAESIVVVVNAWPAKEDARTALTGAVQQVVKETVGVDCTVQLLSPSVGLPMTSSGKLSRSRAKARYLAGEYAHGGRRPVAATT